jgi:hypothetical protein
MTTFTVVLMRPGDLSPDVDDLDGLAALLVEPFPPTSEEADLSARVANAALAEVGLPHVDDIRDARTGGIWCDSFGLWAFYVGEFEEDHAGASIAAGCRALNLGFEAAAKTRRHEAHHAPRRPRGHADAGRCDECGALWTGRPATRTPTACATSRSTTATSAPRRRRLTDATAGFVSGR